MFLAPAGWTFVDGDLAPTMFWFVWMFWFCKKENWGLQVSFFFFVFCGLSLFSVGEIPPYIWFIVFWCPWGSCLTSLCLPFVVLAFHWLKVYGEESGIVSKSSDVSFCLLCFILSRISFPPLICLPWLTVFWFSPSVWCCFIPFLYCSFDLFFPPSFLFFWDATLVFLSRGGKTLHFFFLVTQSVPFPFRTFHFFSHPTFLFSFFVLWP